MTKRKIFWLAIIFILYEVLVWGFSLVFLGDNSILIGAVLTICGITLLGVYILVARLSARAAPPAAAPVPAGPPPPQPPAPAPPTGPVAASPEESQALAALVAEANARLAQSPRLASQRTRSTIADFPVYVMLGSEGSGKTSLFLSSGLEIEAVAGQVQRDSAVVPTRLANIWFAGNSIVAEAGGQFFAADPGRWGRFLELFGPPRNRSAMSKMFAADGRSNVRAIVFCVDITSFIGIPDASRQAGLAQRAQQQLRKAAETLGGDLPVYVVFTKADMIKYFGDYFARMTDAEDQQIFGCTLAPAAPMQFGSSDQYTAAESARLTSALNNLYVSLADKRLRFLERETDRTRKPAVYEFPREVRRIRAPLVQFLVDVFRPNPLQPNPSLRGFYFTGTRKVAAAGSPEQSPATMTGIHRVGEVTHIFRPDEFTMMPGARAGGGQEQSVTRWSFAADLWRSLLRSGQVAVAPMAVNRQQENLRKLLFGGVAAVFLLMFLLFAVSWIRNRSLLNDVDAAAAACEPVPPHTLPSLKYLKEIDHLREEMGILSDYDETHPPLFMRWGLYSGGGLVLDSARRLYFTRFREYFLNDIVRRMETGLGGLPPTQTDQHPYQEVYGDLKIYRTVTKSSAEKACSPDAATVEGLMTRWRGDRVLDPESEKLARANFEFFAASLKHKEVPEELLIESKDQPVVQHARDYLNGFQGAEPKYHAIIEQVNQELQSTARLADLTQNTKYRSVLRVADQVEAAFTRTGWDKVQQLIDKEGAGLGRDSCVMGGGLRGGAAAALGGFDMKRQLRNLYINDYAKRWTDFIGKATALPYSSCGDAGDKLDFLKDNNSPMLAVLLLTAENTMSFPKSATSSLVDEATKMGKEEAKGGLLTRLLPGRARDVAQKKVDQAVSDSPQTLTPDFITQLFQPARAVFEKPNRERWADNRNGPYLNALGELERTIQALAQSGGKCNDGDQNANNQANAQMLKGLDSVSGLARSFDNTKMYDPVKQFLESPIRGVKALIVTDPAEITKKKLNGGQATLCSKVNSLARRYPFNRTADDEVGLDQLNDVFAPQGGALGAVRQLLGDNLVKSGSLWTEKPDAPFKLSRSFLSFFNTMSAISDALYPAQGAKPGMHYKLLVRPNPGVKQVKGILDGDIFVMSEKQYGWPAVKPGIDLRVEQSGGGDQPLRAYPGNWGIFQLLSGADRHSPGTNQFGLVNVQAGKHSLAQAVLPDSSPIVIEVVEFPNGVQRAFESDFFRLGACPAKATED